MTKINVSIDKTLHTKVRMASLRLGKTLPVIVSEALQLWLNGVNALDQLDNFMSKLSPVSPEYSAEDEQKTAEMLFGSNDTVVSPVTTVSPVSVDTVLTTVSVVSPLSDVTTLRDVTTVSPLSVVTTVSPTLGVKPDSETLESTPDRKPLEVDPIEEDSKRHQALEALKESSTEELAALAVRAGIYTEDGELTEAYKSTPDNTLPESTKTIPEFLKLTSEEESAIKEFDGSLDDEEDGEVLEGVEADETDPYKDLFESV